MPDSGPFDPSAARRRAARAAAGVAAALILLYGALLRADILVIRYGPWTAPSWLAALNGLPAATAPVRPPGFVWYHVETPYVGGDPVNYLRYAREMQSFYQGHLREPVFLALTRAWLVLTGGADVSVSLASASASVLAIGATLLLGASVSTRTAALLAALALAIDYDAVSWAPDGWRDDTFMCLVTLTAWAFVRLRRSPTPRRALAAGALAAAACLTRITAVSFILPAAMWLLIDAAPPLRRRLARPVTAAVLVCGLLVAPYLVNCARATGDPFIAIDAHTTYYRAAEGLPFEQPQGVGTYIRAKVAGHPLEALDTSITGLFVLPVANKAAGFGFWVSRLPLVLHLLMAAGVLLFLFVPDGRLLLVIAVTSLVPYALTWNVGGGGEWRFTMHVYPILLVAAAHAAATAAGLLRPGAAAAAVRQVPRRTFAAAGAILVAFAGAALVYQRLPYYVARERVARGESTSLEAGGRDRSFFRDGWLPPEKDGVVTARVTAGSRASLRVPLPAGAEYALVLRMDPVTPDAPSDVTVLLYRQIIGRLALTVDPQRVGSYRLEVPPAMRRAGPNDLEIVADRAVPAGQAGDRYAHFDPAQPIALRFWYLRVIPLPPG
jgi:hypothetical protein